MYYHRKVILALLEQFGGELKPTHFQKLLLLFTRRQRKPVFEFVPYKHGAFSFLAGKCFFEYRKRGGARNSPLPDFYIGAHAAIKKMRLLTRDKNRYSTYFPKLEIIAP